MTETIVSSATREVAIGFDRPVVIIGERDDPATVKLRRAVFDAGLAGRIVVQLEPGADLPDAHPAKGKDQVDGQPTAYVCKGPVCSLPVTEAKDLSAAL